MRGVGNAILVWILLAFSAHAQDFDYQLQAVEVAKDTYVFEGKREDFSKSNGGNIVNTAFIITSAGVIVIDTGPSKRYAEQQRAAIAKITDQPIIKVFLTHHHPDHYLGNQVYKDTELLALADTIHGMKQEGDMFASNLYRLLGDWMRGTASTPATRAVETGIMEVGDHKLELITKAGHSNADLMILDHTSGVLFTGDLVFNNRALTTPHARVEEWLASLESIKSLPFKVLVPGHGQVAKGKQPIEQTHDYLSWLAALFKDGANSGMDMNELMRVDIPERWQGISLVREELERSVTHLYPAIERQTLKPVHRE